MSLGDIYGKVNKSGFDKNPNTVSRSSEDGTSDEALKSVSERTLEAKERELAAYDKQVSVLRREVINADLHKTTDGIVFHRIKAEVEAKLKVIDMAKRRLKEEVDRLKRSTSIRKHL